MKDDRATTAIDTYTSLDEAKQDARSLYILHTKRRYTSQSDDIDIEVVDRDHKIAFSAKHAIYNITNSSI